MTTTQQELDGAFRRVVRSASAAGLETEGWALHGGSKPNGVSYKLATRQRLIHLGMTRTEAWHALSAMADAFEMVEAK